MSAAPDSKGASAAEKKSGSKVTSVFARQISGACASEIARLQVLAKPPFRLWETVRNMGCSCAICASTVRLSSVDASSTTRTSAETPATLIASNRLGKFAASSRPPL